MKNMYNAWRTLKPSLLYININDSHILSYRVLFIWVIMGRENWVNIDFSSAEMEIVLN